MSERMGREGWGRGEKREALPPFFRNVSPTFPRVSLSENATVWPFLVKSVALRYRFRVLRYRYFERIGVWHRYCSLKGHENKALRL